MIDSMEPLLKLLLYILIKSKCKFPGKNGRSTHLFDTRDKSKYVLLAGDLSLDYEH